MSHLPSHFAKKVFLLNITLGVVLLLGCQETVNEVKDGDRSNQSTSLLESNAQVKLDKLPEVLKQAQPSYPPAARKAGIEGMVVVKVMVDTSGNVEKAEIVKSIPELDEAAIEAARKFKFKAASLHEKQVSRWVTIPFHFKLADDK